MQDDERGIIESPLPDGWEEAFDKKSKRTYYVDHGNKTTSWKRPTNGSSSSSVKSSETTPPTPSVQSSTSVSISKPSEVNNDDIPHPSHDNLSVTSALVADDNIADSDNLGGQELEHPTEAAIAAAAATALRFDDESVSTADGSSVGPQLQSLPDQLIGGEVKVQQEVVTSNLASNVLENDDDNEDEPKVIDIPRNWSSSTLSTHGTTLGPNPIQPKGTGICVSVTGDDFRSGSPTPSTTTFQSSSRNSNNSDKKRRGSIMASTPQSVVSTSTELGRSQSKSSNYSVSRNLTHHMPEIDTIQGFRSSNHQMGSLGRKKEVVHVVDDTTSSHSREIQQHISKSKLNSKTSDYYISCAELQCLGRQIKPIMVKHVEANRGTCLVCNTAFGFSGILHTKKFHCKSCGELYCKNHVKRITYPPGTNSDETASVCDNCLCHFSSGDMNCILRYYIVLRDSTDYSDANYKDSLYALHRSIEFETVRKAEGNQRKPHLYKGFYNLLHIIGGEGVVSLILLKNFGNQY